MARPFSRPARYSSESPNSSRYESANALVASGFKMKHGDGDTMRRIAQPWQRRAFLYYDIVPEIKYAAQFYSRALSVLRLYAAVRQDDGTIEETDDPDAVSMLERVQDPGGGGREGLLASYGRLVFLAGETYLVVTKDPDEEDFEQWEMLSNDEIKPLGDSYQRIRAPSMTPEMYHEPSDDDYEPIDDKTAVVYRLWRRHPRFSMLPDSTMMGVLDICEELVLLTQAVRARAKSRLSQGGILLVNGRYIPLPPTPAPGEDPEVDPFMRDLINSFTAPIANEGSAAAVVPHVVRIDVGDDKTLDSVMKLIQVHDPMQTYPETGLRYELIKRLAIGLDMPPEILLGMTDSNHWCVDAETEILTADGWKRHEMLMESDEVLTLNHETGMSEWQQVEAVARFDVEDLPMLSVESRYHSSLTTLNHRWPVLVQIGRDRRWERRWTHSDELRSTHRLVTAAPSRDALWPQWVEHDDALVELVAWLWTEGAIRERPGRRVPQVSIYQSSSANPDNVLRIRAALTSLYGAAVTVPMRGGRGSAIDQQPRWRETQKGNQTVFVLNAAAAERLLAHVGPDRVVSTSFIRTLTASQLALFIETSTRADGSTMRSGCQIVGQKDEARLAPLELAAILLGRSPSSYTQTHDGFQRHEQHYVSVSDRQTVRLKKTHMREERYTGTVWCPVTDNSTWCARRRGRVFFTGNTAWQVDEQTWKGHLQPVANQLVSDLTTSFFQPSLKAAGKTDWNKYVIAYDATAVINHPDRSKDAKDLYDRGELSGAALRESTGFTDEDEPSEQERWRYIGIKVHDGSLALYGEPSIKTGGIEVGPGQILDSGGEQTAPEGGSVGGPGSSDVTKGTPPPPAEGADVVGSLEIDARVARILGASEVALWRARELAGSRIRSQIQRRDEAALIDGIPGRQVAATLGATRATELKLPGARSLVAGASELLLESLRTWGVSDIDARPLGERLEQFAAMTLFETHPGPLPKAFESFVLGLLSTNGNGHRNGDGA